MTAARRLLLPPAADGRPHAVMLIRVDWPGAAPGPAGTAHRRLVRARAAVASVLAALGPADAFDEATIALALPDTPLRRAVALAEATRRGVHAADPRGPVVHAGVAALDQARDAAGATVLAAGCLEAALADRAGTVVCETDPGAPQPGRAGIRAAS